MSGALGFAVTAALMASGVIGGRMMMRCALAASAPVAAPSAPFAAMMIPHHEGAIAMAKAELHFGKDPVLRRPAEGIVIERGQEINVMRRALAERPKASHSSTDAAHSSFLQPRRDTRRQLREDPPMKTAVALLSLALLSGSALAGQVPGSASAPNVRISDRDRFYTSVQFSNMVSVANPSSNTLTNPAGAAIATLAE